MKVIEKNYSVAMPLDPKNRLLLQKKDSGYVFWPNYWCTFGGGMREGEDPKTALLREIDEENGLYLEEVMLFDSVNFEDHSKFGEPIRRMGKVNYFSARFDGDLSKLRLREGAGSGLFERVELEIYNHSELIVPDNYKVIERFMGSI